jgi:hypothetical protein
VLCAFFGFAAHLPVCPAFSVCRQALLWRQGHCLLPRLLRLLCLLRLLSGKKMLLTYLCLSLGLVLSQQ